jgi:hypothetical protein
VRLFPIVLIVLGALGIARHFGLIPVGVLPLIGPVLLIALGVALLLRRRRGCSGDWRTSVGGGRTSAPPPPTAGPI